MKKLFDNMAASAAKEALYKALKDQGIPLDSLVTRRIDGKVDELILAIIEDVGYLKMLEMVYEKLGSEERQKPRGTSQR